MDEHRPWLKPPLGEYFNNSEEPEIEIVRLLLKYNARVITTAGVQHPLGILKCLNKLPLNSLEESTKQDQLDQVKLNEQLAFANDKKAQLFYSLINACELFDINCIKRCSLLNQNQKRVLLHYAVNPSKLKHLARLALRKYVFKFAQSFFNDDQNASSVCYVLENRLNQQQQNSPELRSKSFDYITNDLVTDNWQINDVLNDSYLYNKNSYKKYTGNRYQKCVNRIDERLFYKPNIRQKFYFKNNKLQQFDNSDDKLVFNQEFAISFGLTTDEMEIVKSRREYQLNEQKKNDCLLKSKSFESNDHSITKSSNLDNHNIVQLPIGYRVPPGIDWPIRLIDLDSKFNDYNFKYYSSLNSASSLIDQLREYFNFDETKFKCSGSFAVHILGNLPMPIYLRRYVLYKED